MSSNRGYAISDNHFNATKTINTSYYDNHDDGYVGNNTTGSYDENHRRSMSRFNKNYDHPNRPPSRYHNNYEHRNKKYNHRSSNNDRRRHRHDRDKTKVNLAPKYLPPAKRQLLQQQPPPTTQQAIEQNEKDDDDIHETGKVKENETKSNNVVDDVTNQPKDQQMSINTTTMDKQQQTWEEQQRVIHGTVNRLNVSTIKPLIHDLFATVNIVRLRGVLARSILLAAVSSVQYSIVYAAFVAVINTKLPEVGELIVHRAVLQFRSYYYSTSRKRDKQSCVAIVHFIGHLFHQGIVHELLILQILTVLLEDEVVRDENYRHHRSKDKESKSTKSVSTTSRPPSDDSVEIAIEVMKLTGYTLHQVSPTGVRAIMERFRALLHEGTISPRIVVQMEALLQLRKDGFQSSSTPIPEELDLVEQDDQITFEDLTLDDEAISAHSELETFQAISDTEYTENEQEWTQIKNEVLGIGCDDDDDENSSGSEDGESETDDDEVEDDNEEEENNAQLIEASSTALTTTANPSSSDKLVVHVQDLSEADLVHLRRTIYLTIMSSATYEECAHKLAQISIPPGRENELINMLIECCSQERTFLRYYGMIGSRFCILDDRWNDAFVTSFNTQYNTIHRLETNKLRNVAKFFAHLLYTDSISWSVLSIVHINDDETTSSSRIFIKILLQEITEQLGLVKLQERFNTDDPTKQQWYLGMFPKDYTNLRNTKYAINFFTSIGLGPLTDGLRQYVKEEAPKLILAAATQEKEDAKAKSKDKEDNDDDVSSVVSSSSSSSSFSSSSSGNSSSSSSRSSYSSSSYSSSSSDDHHGNDRRRRSKNRGRSRRISSSSSASYTSSEDDDDSRRRRRSKQLTSGSGRSQSDRESRLSNTERSRSGKDEPVQRRIRSRSPVDLKTKEGTLAIDDPINSKGKDRKYRDLSDEPERNQQRNRNDDNRRRKYDDRERSDREERRSGTDVRSVTERGRSGRDEQQSRSRSRSPVDLRLKERDRSNSPANDEPRNSKRRDLKYSDSSGDEHEINQQSNRKDNERKRKYDDPSYSDDEDRESGRRQRQRRSRSQSSSEGSSDNDSANDHNRDSRRNNKRYKPDDDERREKKTENDDDYKRDTKEVQEVDNISSRSRDKK